ncbi:MAG TPA: hypothetical protein VFY37_06850, partial [Solirubrobacterales bacterium]|nr:hypothetical protein [Solirubrobacterales bacterium]
MSRVTARAATAVALAGSALAVCASAAVGSEGVSARAAAAPSAQLTVGERVPVPGGGLIHRYRQRAGGLPVFGAEAVVADPPDSAPVLVTDTTAARIEPTHAD